MPRPDQLYQNLLVELRRQVLNSFAPGETLPSQRALADMHGVGQATVHRALSTLVKEGLVEARPRLGWLRSAQKGSVKGKGSAKSLRVGIISRRSKNEFASYEIYQALLDESRSRGIEVVLVPNLKEHHPTPGRNRVELRRVPWNAFDVGLLVEIEDAATLGDPLLKKHSVLAVDLDATPFGIESVTFDDYGAGRVAARHLFDLGHRRFALTDEVNGPGWPAEATWTERSHGFQAEVGRLGGCIRPEYRVACSRSGREFDAARSGSRAIECWLALPEKLRPTALFAIDPSPLPNLIDAMKRRSLSVPRDLSIIAMTWSGAPKIANLSFTTIQVDLAGLVRRTLDAAAEMAQRTGKTSGEPRLHVAPTLLVPGETTAPPPVP
jgi:DNA-binding LacI/PurR family transcriptional regulator